MAGAVLVEGRSARSMGFATIFISRREMRIVITTSSVTAKMGGREEQTKTRM